MKRPRRSASMPAGEADGEVTAIENMLRRRFVLGSSKNENLVRLMVQIEKFELAAYEGPNK